MWYVVRSCCQRAGLDHIAPHDLRKTCAKLCHSSGGELDQIQFLWGHVWVQATERYLGCKQNLGHPVNDRFTLGIALPLLPERFWVRSRLHQVFLRLCNLFTRVIVDCCCDSA